MSVYIWQNCLEFSDEMDLSIQMKTINNIKHCSVSYLKFGEINFTFLKVWV